MKTTWMSTCFTKKAILANLEEARAKATIIRAKEKEKRPEDGRVKESLVERKDQEKEVKMDPKEKAHKERVGLRIGATHNQISKESRSG